MREEYPISYTQIRTWERCRLQWWLLYREHVAGLQAEELRLGCEVHECMARIGAELLQAGQSAVDVDLLPFIDRLLASYEGAVQELVRALLPKMVLPEGSVYFEQRLEKDGVCGVIDILGLDTARNAAHVVDWKTSLEQLSERVVPLQIGLYAGLVYECYGVEKVMAQVRAPAATLTWHVSPNEAAERLRYARALRERLRKLRERPEANPGGHCHSCQVAHACGARLTGAGPADWARQYEQHMAAAAALRRLLREHCTATGKEVAGWGWRPRTRVEVQDPEGLFASLLRHGKELAEGDGPRVRNQPVLRVFRVNGEQLLRYSERVRDLRKHFLVFSELRFGKEEADAEAG